MIPAAFSAFAAPRANSGGARLHASADVSKGEEAQSQWSNHALLGSSGVLLARVKGLDVRAMRRGAVPAGEPPARQLGAAGVVPLLFAGGAGSVAAANPGNPVGRCRLKPMFASTA